MTEQNLAADAAGGTEGDTVLDTANDTTDTTAAVTTDAAADTTTADTEAGTTPDTTEADGDDKPVEPTWPEDWREQAAGDDAELLRELKRYSSPKTMARALREAKATIRSGKLKPSAPDPSDEKAMAEWRKEQGIPDAPEGYKIPEPVAKRLGDQDKPVLSNFLEFAHGKNAPPGFVEMGAEWYAEFSEAQQAQIAELDRTATETAEDTLRKDWGPEYRPNLQLAKRAIEEIPGVGPNWSEFRDPATGKRLGDNPEFVMWAADQGRNRFGDATFANSDSAAQHSSRKSEIEKIMKTDWNRYNRENLGAEYAQILEREMKRR